MFESVESVHAALEGLATTEARLGVSTALILLSLVGSYVIAPVVARRSVRFVRRRLHTTESETTLGALEEHPRWSLPMRAIVRTFQTAVGVATALALLVVWGYTWAALAALAILAETAPYLVRVLLTIALVFGAIAGSRYLEGRLEVWLENSTYVTRHQEGVAFRVLQVCIFVAVGLAALSLWNRDLGGLLVGAGFLGIVVGMAARRTLGSLIAGFVLMFSRPFEIGDWVEVDDHEGVVADITIVNTRLRSFDGETVVLPNDRVSNSTVTNRSKRKRLRLRLEVGIDYDADVERAEAVALEAIRGVENVAEAPEPEAFPTAFDDSALRLECRFWIQPPNARKRWRAQAAVVRAVKEAFDREGIEIPYPRRELSRRRTGEEFRYTEERADAAPPGSEQ